MKARAIIDLPEMPNDCEPCRCMITDMDEEIVYCIFDCNRKDIRDYDNGRKINCPLSVAVCLLIAFKGHCFDSLFAKLEGRNDI